jgi:DNA ligase-1
MISDLDLMNGRDWQPAIDVTGWVVTEKLDGVRAYWDGEQLWTRSGHVIKAPASFRGALPAGIQLDGELWAGRGCLAEAVSAANFGHFTPSVSYRVFDMPNTAGTWLQRIKAAQFACFGCPVAQPVELLCALNRLTDLLPIYEAVTEHRGEGLVLRHPTAEGYQRGARTYNIIKIKAEQARAFGSYLNLRAA